ncbi:cornulin [Acomys russatus]|uniref:cornulin n=1 Tax=Acomys russatus TaxID=60746 RepID=UPI0021E30C93|nr:cornulin [Acomys russatus]
MPQLLQNIHGIIEAFRCYARSEGGCKVLTRGEMKRLLEQEFAEVIAKPHDPATVDEVLRLLDEDNTRAVEFKEFLVLVFKVARACFETLNASPRGDCMSDKSESCYPGSSKELEQGQRGSTQASRDGAEQCCDSKRGQRDQASGGQVRVATPPQSQDSYPTQASSHDRQAEPQRQEMVTQQIQAMGQVGQRTEDESCAKERRSQQPLRISQQTDEITAGTATQTQAGTFYTQESACDQNRDSNSHGRARGQEDQASTQHYQAREGSHTQIHTQTVEQGWGQQTGSGRIQTQGSIFDQNRETETQVQDRNEGRQVVKEHDQAQAESYTQTHTQTSEQGRRQQAGNSSIQTHGAIYGQNRETEIHGQDSIQARQVGTGHCQTQEGSYTQTLEQDESLSTSQVGDREKGQTQVQSCVGQSWTPVHNYDTGEPVLGGQVQTETNTVKERQEWSGNHPSLTGEQGERVPTMVREERANDHTKEMVTPSQDAGSLHSGIPSAQIQDTAQLEEEEKGERSSYSKTDQP